MIEQLIKELEGAGYNCFVPLEKRSCFDIAAKGEHFLLLKVFSNIDSVREAQAKELKSIASTMGAIPLIIGEHSKTYTLERGMVYERYGLTTISPETFIQILGGALPRKRFYRGRVVAEIDSAKLAGTSPSELAKELQVTREAIYSYRDGSRVEFEKAEKIEKILQEPVIQSINVLSVPLAEKPVLGGYLRQMEKLGFEVVPVRRGFDALARERESLLIDEERSEAYAKRKAKFVTKAAKFFDSEPVIVMEKRHDAIKGIPVIGKGEIRDAESAEGLIDLVKKRKK